MVLSNQIAPGMTLLITGKLFRVESSVKVTVPKGQPFIKTRLRSLDNDKVSEKNFKVGQEVKEVSLQERKLEFLYLEEGRYLFLDTGNLEKIFIPSKVIGDKIDFLKEGIAIRATLFGDQIFTIELPQFLELMIAKTEPPPEKSTLSSATKKAILETGAEIEVPRFIETGDVIKVDTRLREYIQRV